MTPSVLQQELGKRNPFDSPEQEACLNLVRTLDHVQAHFGHLLGAHGISGPQYNVLRILRGHGGSGVPSQVISGQMVTRMPDITRLVDRLEQAGLVERSRTAEDRRLVIVKITAAGLDLLARLDRPILDLHQRLLGHLTRQELAQLNALLVKARRLPEESSGAGGSPARRQAIRLLHETAGRHSENGQEPGKEKA